MKYFHKLLPALLLGIGSLPLQAQCYELVWAEEFDSTGVPDTETWNFETGGGGWGNNELEYYKSDTSNAYVEDGTLVITARKESYGGREYTSARLTTKDKFEFQYGKIEARMRLPYGQGIWPAFWMLGENISEAGWPACGEIDIMEMIGGGARENTVHGTVFWDHNGSNADYGQPYSLPTGIFADTFHLFSVEWTPQTIRWFVDGTRYNIIDIKPSPLSEFHNEFFVILNLAVGGNWPGSPDATTVFPQHLEVDYIRVYKNGGDFAIAGEALVGQRSMGLSYTLPYSDSLGYAWSVPEDAEIMEGQGTAEITVNWGCTGGEVSCSVTGKCGTYQPFILVAVENSVSGPLFADENAGDLVFSIEAMSETSYAWSVPEDAEILEGQGTNTLHVQWASLFTEVSLMTTNSCGTCTFSHKVLKTGQYPYPDPLVSHAIPGSINATDFDYGGEGVAYHDLTAANEGDGVRQDERIDTQNSDNNTPNVGWILAGEWMDYSIRADSSRAYDATFRVATANASGGPFSVLVNGEERMGPIPVPGTGGWDKFITLRPGSIFLYESDTVMRIHFTTGGFNLGNISFTPASTNSTGISRATGNIFIHPNPATGIVMMDHPEGEFSYQIIGLTGSVVMQGTSTRQREEIDISGLPAGTYLLISRPVTGIVQTGKFIKLPK
ncbi:MAG: family 16 glycosylhydrolase [Bacteroidota bacterium]